MWNIESERERSLLNRIARFLSFAHFLKQTNEFVYFVLTRYYSCDTKSNLSQF